MTVNGEVRTDGIGYANRAGGAGGSIFLDVGTIAGAGVLSARGGSGSGASFVYGGGGGGRIAVLYTTDIYTGMVHVHGGTGRNAAEANNGGGGTLYYKGTAEPYGFLAFDNGTVNGWTHQPAFDMSSVNLTVGNAKVSFDCAGGPVRVHDFRVGQTGVVSHPAASVLGLDLRVGGDAAIESGCQLNTDARGYGEQAGPGGGTSGAGGSHGGTGGYGGAPVYDDILAPAQLGSGGGNTAAGGGGAGGGLIHLEVAGSLTLDGELRANGVWESNRGGGAGGAIYVTCNTLAGAGSISANAGTGSGGASYAWGAGGGGRVALHYSTTTFTGTATAKGGVGRSDNETYNSGAGTLYTKGSADPIGQLVFDNGGVNGWTVHPALDMSTTDIRVSSGLVSFDCVSGPVRARDFAAGPNATVSHPPGNTSGLDIRVTRDAAVDGTSKLWATERGYGAQAGPGGGASGAGGSHGGTGGYGGMPVYHSITAPSQLGSGGGDTPVGSGMPGGGLIHVEAAGTLTLDGTIEANGGAANNVGAGAGGGVFLSAGTFAGLGIVYAMGGSNTTTNYWHGGGGGGRIAVLYGTNSFGGSMTARGGLGRSSLETCNGGAGTIYTKGSADATGSLLISNGSVIGWTAHPAFDMPTTDMTVADALLSIDCTLQPLNVNRLTVGPSATLTHPSGLEVGLQVDTAGDVVVLSGAQINTDGRGYDSQLGPGAGTSGAGGSHGGTGGYLGAAVNDSISTPVLLGSGGGATALGSGAPGRGRVTLTCGGLLNVDGTISANGFGYANRGCGAGGSILLTAPTLGGSGSISAVGGSDSTTTHTHGGGGGGRIALYCDSDVFTGTATARGGLGTSETESNNGGPGTIYRRIPTKASGDPLETVLFDNGSVIGWTIHPAFDMPGAALIAQNARVRFDCSSEAVHVRSLDARSGSILSQPAGQTTGLAFHAEAEANVAAGALLDVSFQGYPAQSGPGGGAAQAGGSYGGRGGKGGADPYGIADLPAFLGSGGGNASVADGGAGGGMLTILAAGSVNIDGHLLANGEDMLNGGGGAGGSIRVAALSLTGAGIIAADGGESSGATYPSGGGGGGRIGLYVQPGQASFPSGTVTVAGGTGVGGNGEVGTIFRGDTYTLPDLSFIAAHSEFHWDLNGDGEANLRVVNWGLADATSVRVELFSGDPANPGSVSLGHTTIGTLGPLTSVLVTIPVAPQALTDIWAVVDPAGDIGEGNEANNVLVFSAVRTPTSLYVQDKTGTIGEVTPIRGWLKRLSDNAWLPGRTVTYKVDGTLIGTAVTDSNGKAEILWTITDGPASRTINGSWPGDDTYAPSAGNGTLTAQTWQTKMSGVDRTGPIASYRVLKAWLWKMDNTPIPSKSILFKLDGTVLGSDNTRATGYAQIGYTIEDGAGAGDREVRAEWAGDGGYLPSSCTNTLTVTKATPYIWVMPRTVVQGGIARFYAYFRRLPDYRKQEGKTLSFRIDGTWIVDVVTLSGTEAGIARYQYTTDETVGDHTLRAEFAGDAWVDAGYGEANLRITAP